tara:strand:- start:7191 stop:7370 length:180 start_codon:yes stop_codon:yes gene_type:complete
MNDHVPFVGAGGTLASLSLGQWNEVIGITVGVLTGIYVIIRIVLLCKSLKEDKDGEKEE